jgi:diguanylate cyclase (GGDEF)-like protein
MNTIALAAPVVVGLEVCSALGLAWLCWRLGMRRNLVALRDIARALIALGVAALTQLLVLSAQTTVGGALLDLGRSLSIWMYLGFMALGAMELATNNLVTDRVRRNTMFGAGVAAALTAGISLLVARDVIGQDLVRHALRACGTLAACVVIARVVSQAPAPPKMVLGASVVRLALCVVALLAAARVGVVISRWVIPQASGMEWAALPTLEFVAHCALCVGLVMWLLDRDWALADASIQSAEHRAASDALTGLPNRTILMDRLDMALASAKRGGAHVGVLYIDLDEFKDVNDRYGHLAGDAVLQVVGARLQRLLRASDTVGRIGGDEFVAISPYLRHSGDLAVVVAKVREALHHVVEHDGVRISIDGSVGAALYPVDGDSPTALLAVADTELYRDKADRRARRLAAAQIRPSIRSA